MAPVIFAGVNGYLDKIPVSEVGRFEKEFLAHLKASEPAIIDEIKTTGAFSKETLEKLKDVTRSFSESFN
jgi:F-type H+-transporting ATPase subunit alpha